MKKKGFNIENTMDLFDDFPEEIIDKWRDIMDGNYSNGGYYYSIVEKSDCDILGNYLFEQGYLEGEKVLIKISW